MESPALSANCSTSPGRDRITVACSWTRTLANQFDKSEMALPIRGWCHFELTKIETGMRDLFFACLFLFCRVAATDQIFARENPGVSITRRTFLQQSGMMGASLILPQAMRNRQMPPVRPLLDPNSLTQFVDPLPIPEVARASGFRPGPTEPHAKLAYYRLAMREIESKVHRDVKPTRLWGFGSSSPGPTIETRSGQGLLVEWANELPTAHFLPIDHNIHGAEADKPDVRAVVHLHGAKAAPESDGYPENWYVPGKSALYHYPNNQDATMLWYHDHALGINRLNVVDGLLGAFVIRDSVEDSLNLPRGKYEIPLIIYDRIFDAQGQLYYPVSPDPKAPWVPEVFGEAHLFNGKLFPYLDVEPRKYRFRILNGANGRFYWLSMSQGAEIVQIGSDQGLLAAPVAVEHVHLAPGERADVVVDFAPHRGQQVVLESEALTLMQFRVAPAPTTDPSAVPATLRPAARIAESAAVTTRRLTLDEQM